MTSQEYGRHARRILEWDEVEADPTPRRPTDLAHGAVFPAEERRKAGTLGERVGKLLTRKIG